MSSTFSQNINLEKPGTGDQPGTWGVTANNNYDVLDTAIDGFIGIPLPTTQTTPSAPIILSTTQGQNTADMPPGLHKVLAFTGNQGADGYVQINPTTAQRLYFCRNLTTDSAGGAPHNLIFQQVQTGQSPGSTFTLQAGCDAVLYADGAGNPANVLGAIDNPQFNHVTVTGNLSVAGNLSLTGSQTQNAITLDTTSVTDVTKIRQILYTTSSSNRWAVQATTGAESGSNAGSDLKILRYTDAGALPADGSAMYMTRANGNVTIGPGNDMGARLAVVASAGSNQTVLNVQCVAGQSAPAFLVRDDSGTATANKFAVDSAGNLRVYGVMQMWGGGTGQNGWSGSITGSGLNLVFVGGVLVGA